MMLLWRPNDAPLALLDNRNPDRADMGGGADVYERWGSGMSDWREELIEKMAREIGRYSNDTPWTFFVPEARAALAVAEPVIREQCAEIADKTPYAFNVAKDMNTIAAAIREGGKDDI